MQKTLEDIALELNLSTATISRALNKGTQHLVRENTKNRIFDLVKRTGFKPNLQARGLASGKLTNLFFIMSQNEDSVFYDQYFFYVMRGIQDVIIDMEYSLSILSIENDFTEDQIYDILLSHETAGLILSPYCFYTKFPFDAIKGSNTYPIVTLDIEIDSKNVHSIVFDHVDAGYKGAEFLWKKGYRQFVLISDIKHSYHSDLRREGFYDFFKTKKGERFVVDEFQYLLSDTSSLSVLEKITKVKKSPVGIFALSDEIAIGMINNLSKTGIKCPEDIGILGFDGLRVGRYSVPSLSSVGFPFRAVGRQAAEIIIKALKKQKVKKTYNVKANIIEGDSC
ncbi:MAG: LacI family DNA-binding transcriptional regulator [Candidatus Omnitrophica bacterium]|nr:LacI family DNA-binding transcriptional regulator [Candidatus Omnitrophota bacterium]